MNDTRGIILIWQRLLVEHLAREQPSSHTSVVAVALSYVTHSNPDGSHAYPSLRTVGREAGVHHSTARKAIDYLLAEGFMKKVGNRAHGVHEYRLTIPQSSDELHSGVYQSSDELHSGVYQSSDEPKAEGQVSDQSSDQSSDEPKQPPTSDLLAAAASSLTDDAFYLTRALGEAKADDARRRKNNQEPIRNLEAWAQKKAESADFRARVDSELKAAAAEAKHSEAIERCDRCDDRGHIGITNDGRLTTSDDPEAGTLALCGHMQPHMEGVPA